jgi:hypothetical protein
MVLGELSLGIRKEELFQTTINQHFPNNSQFSTYNIIPRNLVDLCPRIHHPSIVISNDQNEIHTLGMKLLDLLNVWRKMVCLASRSECAGDAHNHDFLAGKVLVRIVNGGDAAHGGVQIGDLDVARG